MFTSHFNLNFPFNLPIFVKTSNFLNFPIHFLIFILFLLFHILHFLEILNLILNLFCLYHQFIRLSLQIILNVNYLNSQFLKFLL